LKKIVSNISSKLLCQDIDQLGKENLLISRGDFDVFWAGAAQIPNVLQEIGRLRELTFRSVGEGTGKAVDIDEYDKYYYNLFIWDRKKLQIVGGYRLGMGKEIMEKGIDHFYINSLFKIDSVVFPILTKSIELGRSYIVEEYQKAFLPFFLLWRGILSILQLNTHYQYLIGPVSISKFYSGVCKSIIVKFVKRHLFDDDMAQYFHPRTPFKFESNGRDLNEMIDQVEAGNLKDLESFLNTIEPNHIKVPILLKQYTKLNARFISFNIDPNFSNALDGLMILDIKDLPAETLELLNNK